MPAPIQRNQTDAQNHNPTISQNHFFSTLLVGSIKLPLGKAVFLEADHAEIEAGPNGLRALLAHAGPDVNPSGLS
ncbi:MAG: hypothetical protein ACREDL_02110, partial [Bradyrhizobium sp.]